VSNVLGTSQRNSKSFVENLITLRVQTSNYWIPILAINVALTLFINPT